MKTHNNHNKGHHAQSQFAEETRALLDATSNLTDDLVVQARNRVKSAMEAAQETCADVKEKVMDGAKATDVAIRENVYQSLGIAFGVGALVGFLLTRRSGD